MSESPQFLMLIPSALRRLIDPRLRHVRAPRGRTIVGAGSRSTDVFFVVEGEIQVLIYSPQGREVSVRELGPGAVFGELAALDGAPRSASVMATTEARLVVMSQTDFMACLAASPPAALWLLHHLAAEVRRLTGRVFELSALNMQARLHCELLRLARRGADSELVISPAPTHAELANRIGSHREAVTREMRALSQMNVIRNRRRRLEFLDLDHLERVVRRQVGALDQPEKPS
ncbi:MAG: Crp/Fnr family transcriptional regulator [Phenylobacterium sp.]|uniref:Crp/Fnr family transcriptional regulator n=1 Tax=Phenylobacterium sp. TaxID=1871053 RepID=UPI002734E992|nr:Crp/Fnr family transcriptional regulator [Phenylobacterium sp.]MDP3746709.1 Crp/Fnr family transcriptional regulator [Phenylobacterium sp.]